MFKKRLALILASGLFAGCESGNTPTAPTNPNPGAATNAAKNADVKAEAGKRNSKPTNVPVGPID